MPEPVRSGQRYMPGLDGLRAIAVLAVIAFHEQLGWAPGGLLGVGLFFTLSGYLITDLLLGQWAARGRLALGDFWARRARRLLPALFVMLIMVSAWITLADRARLSGLRGAVIAAATYSSNWYLIDQKQSYFARFAPAAPMDHLWSLAVEEQFYLFWPWLLLGGLLLLRLRRRGREGGVAWLALPTLALAAGSTIAMLMLYHPGFDPTRVYEGTDTRAGGLLIGAALAMAWPSRRAAASAPNAARRVGLDLAALAGLAVIAVMIWRTGQYSPFLYRGGLGLLSVATAAVIAAAALPGSVTGRVLGWTPLRWLGVRSYGVYLWHYPVIVLATPANAGEDLTRAAWQTAATVILAALSWRFVEQPVRRGALGRLRARVRSPRQLARRPRVGYLVAAAGATAVTVAACTGLASPAPAATASTGSLAAGSSLPQPPAAQPGQPAGGVGSARPGPGGVSGVRASGGQASASSVSAAAAAAPMPASTPGIPSPALHPVPGPSPLPVPHTSCQAVAHIGDSTSEGMVSSAYLPDPSQRLVAQYQDVGVHQVVTNIVGANSVVETLPGDTNGYNAARGLVAGGFHGCWVIALGTNDTADVAIGSNVGRLARIQEMMSVAHGEPVMWVDVISLLNSGPYAESNMQAWNAALRQACSSYPNMRIFDWASVAQPEPGWFISDGIHYTSAGYAVRGQQIAYALAAAFPAKGHSSGCVVNLAELPGRCRSGGRTASSAT
jgi:peptidoglycan/LPS O-acetylase OafA/YrhL/lysophospholipase L1-like esterase